MQVNLRVLPTKVFFSFKQGQSFFPSFFTYHVIFQDQSQGEIADMIGEDDIII